LEFADEAHRDKQQSEAAQMLALDQAKHEAQRKKALMAATQLIDNIILKRVLYRQPQIPISAAATQQSPSKAVDDFTSKSAETAGDSIQYAVKIEEHAGILHYHGFQRFQC
jgi:hypothetical protein